MFHDTRGVSLVELLIYVGIFSAISAVFIGVLFHANIGWTRSKVESEVQQNIRFAMEDITRTVRQASAIASPNAGSSGSSLTAVVNGQNVLYSLSGGALQKQVGAEPAENITTSNVTVSNLSFLVIQNTAASNNAVQATSTQFAMTVAYNATNEQFAYTQHATSTALLR